MPNGWITLEGLEIGRGYDGIKFMGAHDITIQRNWIHHSISPGILGSGKCMAIDRNFISHNGDSHFDHDLYLSRSYYNGGSRPWPSGGAHDVGAYEYRS